MNPDTQYTYTVQMRDSLGNTRFILDANSGAFLYTPNDSTLLRITSGSPFEIEVENTETGETFIYASANKSWRPVRE